MMHRHRQRKPDPGTLPRDSGAVTDHLFESIANSTYDWESWIGRDGRALWINPAVERMTGHTVAECLAMSDYPLALVHPDDRTDFAACVRAAADGTSGNDHEFRVLHRDGRTLWGAVSWQPIRDDDGHPLGFRTSIRDITDRKAVEQQLRDAWMQADRANRSKATFLASASHDLRQPLQAATLFVEALDQRVTDPGATAIVESVRNCLASAGELLDALLDISRLEAGVLQPQYRVFALIDLLEHVHTDLEPIAAQEGVDIRIVPTSVFVESDPVLLGRVVRNLIANAIRYRRRGRVVAGVRRHGGSLRIEVWDNGVGIAETALEHIYEEFYQLDNPHRDRTRGLGLGLAVVARLASVMGLGHGVRSWPGRGSMFWIEVRPAPATAALTWAPVEHESPRLDGALIAAIDDDPVQLEALGAFLARTGAELVAAADVDTLVQRLGQRSVDVLVIDYRLGNGVSGIDVIGDLRTRLGCRVPALLLTGDTEPTRLAEADRSGMRLLHKPVAPRRLLAALAEAVR